jgi:hypothetical protein
MAWRWVKRCWLPWIRIEEAKTDTKTDTKTDIKNSRHYRK